MIRRCGTRVAVDLHQPDHRPQALYRHEAAGHRQAERRKAPEMAAGEDPADAAPLRGQAFAGMAFRRLFGDAEKQPGGGKQRRHGEQDKNLAPARDVQQCLERCGRGECAEAAGRHHPAGQRRLPLGRIPLRECLEGCHQAGRDAEADDGAGKRQSAHAVGHGKQRGTGGGEDEQRRLDATCAEAVEQHAKRQLRETEGKQIGARKQAEITRREAEFTGEFGPDHGVRRAEEIGEEVGRCERQQQDA